METPLAVLKRRALNEGQSVSTPTGATKAGCPSLSIPASPFMQKLGWGTGVNVYLLQRKGNTKKESPWAIKKINLAVKDKEYSDRLKLEAEVLRRLHHPNIIEFRLFSRAADGSLALAMQHGHCCLYDMLEERRHASNAPLPANDILSVAKDICSALSYLHEEKHMLHGDIKSANVLTMGGFSCAKLCDFGVVLPLDQSLAVADPEAEYVGTQAWSAPEVFADATICDRTDMWAFGCTVLEMLSLNAPHNDIFPDDDELADMSPTEQEDVFTEAEQAWEQVLGTRPALPDVDYDVTYIPVLELFYACTAEVPAKRCSARSACEALQAHAPDKENKEPRLRLTYDD